MRRSRHEPGPACGFTLIELMAALAIALLVAAVLFAAYHATLRTSERQGRRGRAAAGASAALDQVTRDLTCALQIPEARALRFTLDPASPERRLAFCTAVPPPADPDMRWFSMEHVTYRMRGEMLYRIARPLPGDGRPATTNVTARGLRSLETWAWSGGAWTNTWPLGERSEPLPPAVRVRVTMADAWGGTPRSFEAEVYVPGGNAFTSRITRVGAAAGTP